MSEEYINADPATKDTGDLNSYTEKNDDKVIIAGMPKHNLDQDTNAGPGIQKTEDKNTYTTKNDNKVVIAGK